MSLPVVLQLEARTKFDAAFDRYEQQQPGFGVDFVTQVQEVFDRISHHTATAIIISARAMSTKERRTYGRK